MLRMKLLRRLTCFLCLFWIISVSFATVSAAEPTYLLIIHQIRGNEQCCRPGSPDMARMINDDKRFINLPLSWALRYDVLTDDEAVVSFTNLPKIQTLGMLLEITPKLASASGVVYKGDAEGLDWQNARQAFLIGYTQIERKKLIDTVCKAFYDRFQFYPTFTVSWMIDSWSLGYLRETYGVRLHELTKEQYETDGYTLSGGVFNLPYWPLRSHPLVPAKNKSEQLDLLIVRQTISDIEKNYGSVHSFYTSQPNDYLVNPQPTDFNYFTKLLDQVAAQSVEQQFAVIGLENSLEWRDYKEEYMNQLAYIADKQKSRVVQPVSPYEYYTLYRNTHALNPNRLLKSETFPESGVMWYFGQDYRARLEIWEEGLVLTDLRIYTQLTDPYQQEPAAVSKSYWIMPYLIDSSQMGMELSSSKSENSYHNNSIRNDTGAARFGMVIAKKIKEVNQESDGTVMLTSETGHVRLSPNVIEIESSTSPHLLPPIQMTLSQLLDINSDQYVIFAGHPRFFLKPYRDKKRVDLGWENQALEQVMMATVLQTATGWRFIPNRDLTLLQLESLSSIFQPDRATLPFDPQISTIFWHNQEAIAGKSPVRLFIDPRNSLNRPVAVKSMTASVDSTAGIEVVTPHSFTSKMESFLIEFTSSQKSQGQVRVSIDGNIIPNQPTIRFYPNCRELLVECVKSIEELLGFTKIVWREKSQKYEVEINVSRQKFERQVRTMFEQIKLRFPKNTLW